MSAFTLHEQQIIGERIWKNECNQTVKGLTFWNQGEAFPSMGIGHFIWYPEGVQGPFQETFPSLISFLQKRKVKVPEWMTKKCPWREREAFYRAFDEEKLVELRALLASTLPLQAEFIVERFEASMQKFPLPLKKQIQRVMGTPEGAFALIDYLNFKGDGMSEKERYQGVGWGLYQVLEGMGEGQPLNEFIASAKRALQRRVELSSPERDEKKWLPGWLKRIESYGVK